jgi:hypothetical protein
VVLCCVGSARVLAGWRTPVGGYREGGIEGKRERRRGPGRSMPSGSSFTLDANYIRQREKISLKILCLQREDSQQLPFPPFGRLRRRKREKRDGLGSRVCIAGFQIQNLKSD